MCGRIKYLAKKPTQKITLQWQTSKNALIELIYALYFSNAIAGGNIREIARKFEYIFEVDLGDIHNSFHKMKYRAKGVSIFLDKLKQCLEKNTEEKD